MADERREADRWTPSNYVRNLTYVIKEIGMTGLVILVLLGQKTGWVPDVSMTNEAHRAIAVSTLQVVDANRNKLDQLMLNVLRTKDYAQQACLEGKPKAEFYKCMDGYNEKN
ncbi:MAG: hypothetical protein AB7T38_02400 [Nitrospirales bacterium]